MLLQQRCKTASSWQMIDRFRHAVQQQESQAIALFDEDAIYVCVCVHARACVCVCRERERETHTHTPKIESSVTPVPDDEDRVPEMYEINSILTELII
jgi:hypothetical protein